jgi:hypothetical protein
MCQLGMTKTPLINTNLVPQAFGAKQAMLLAPVREPLAPARLRLLCLAALIAVVAAMFILTHKQCSNCLQKTSLLQTMTHL